MTAVEWLLEQINNVKPNQFCSIETIKKWCELAKEMEKQQKEKMYTEEEVLDLLAGFVDSRGKDFIPFKDIQEWFKTYKPST